MQQPNDRSWLFGLVLALSLSVAQAQGQGQNGAEANATRPVQTFELDKTKAIYQVVERGANHRVWKKAEIIELEDGSTEEKIHSYTELTSGMHFWNEEEERWEEAQAIIEPHPGGAVAQHGQQKIIFSRNLNTVGSVDILTPDGIRLQGSVIGLGYYDALTGQSEIIANLKSSIGELIGDNQIIYRDAFDGVKADVLYTYSLTGLEQDVILRENPPSPSEFNLQDLTTRLEVLTEWYDVPEPEKTSKIVGRKITDQGLRDLMVEPDMVDERLSFGEVSIGDGKAFWQNKVSEFDEPIRIPVAKKWEVIDGRTVLIEAVEYDVIKAELQKLPSTKKRASLERADKEQKVFVSLLKTKRKLPKVDFFEPVDDSITKSHNPSKGEDGFIIDYSTVSGSYYGYYFEKKSTYYISGSCSFSSYATLDAGTVIKIAPGASSCTFYGAVNCWANDYQPIFITAKDDDTIGATISGSTGTPSGYYGYTFFKMYAYSSAIDLHNVNIRYTQYPFQIWNSRSNNSVRNTTILNSNGALDVASTSAVTLENVLIDHCDSFAIKTDSSSSVDGSNLTVFDSPKLVNDGDTDLTLQNSILVEINTLGSFSGNNQSHNFHDASYTYSDVFKSVGAGDFYLKENSSLRDFHSAASISNELQSDFQIRTTYAPTNFGDYYHFQTNTTLNKHISRDVTGMDLGYHYLAADYALGGATVDDGVEISVEKDTVLMGYNYSGLTYDGDSGIIMRGTAQRPIILVNYRSAQEQPFGWGTSSFLSSDFISSSWSSGDDITFIADYVKTYGLNNYIDFAHLTRGTLIYTDANIDVKVRNCQFIDTDFYVSYDRYGYGDSELINNLFIDSGYQLYGNVEFHIYNNTVFKNQLLHTEPENGGLMQWQVFDNFSYDNSWDGPSNTSHINHGYNAYIHAYFPAYNWRLQPTHSWDVVRYSWSIGFSSGHLGDYYLASSGSPLWDSGSRSAADAGLYHHTSKYTYAKEGSSTVDMGFHYVATDTNGFPIDTDGDLIPDYIEDTDGDGVFDAGETDWQSSENGTTGVPGLQVFFP